MEELNHRITVRQGEVTDVLSLTSIFVLIKNVKQALPLGLGSSVAINVFKEAVNVVSGGKRI